MDTLFRALTTGCLPSASGWNASDGSAPQASCPRTPPTTPASEAVPKRADINPVEGVTHRRLGVPLFAVGELLLTVVRRTWSAEVAEVARTLQARKTYEAEHGPVHDTFDREAS